MPVVTIRPLPSGLDRWAPDCCPDVGRFVGVGPGLTLDAPDIFLCCRVTTNTGFPLRFCPWCGASWAVLDWSKWRQEFVTKEERALRWEKTGRFSPPTTKATLPVLRAVITDTEGTGQAQRLAPAPPPRYRLEDTSIESATERPAACPVVAVQMHTGDRLACRLPKGHDGPHDYNASAGAG